jgi:hypothetical protein
MILLLRLQLVYLESVWAMAVSRGWGWKWVGCHSGGHSGMRLCWHAELVSLRLLQRFGSRPSRTSLGQSGPGEDKNGPGRAGLGGVVEGGPCEDAAGEEARGV